MFVFDCWVHGGYKTMVGVQMFAGGGGLKFIFLLSPGLFTLLHHLFSHSIDSQLFSIHKV